MTRLSSSYHTVDNEFTAHLVIQITIHTDYISIHKSKTRNTHLFGKKNAEPSNKGLTEEEIVGSEEKRPREGAEPGQIMRPVD